jgi:SAM-dependent methyltransferase
LSEDGRRQQQHYDRIAADYLDNLTYPHTQEYLAYLDRAFLELVDARPLGTTAEVCCGAGEAFDLLGARVGLALGADVSVVMLEAARRRHRGPNRVFVQGDATRLPLADGAFDTVVMLGGIHHVNDRAALFREVARILKPGGRFYWREPADDFFVWRWLRRVVYRLSPTLDAETERPIQRRETEHALVGAGFAIERWRTLGFVWYCALMNSDVLVVARLWRFIPGIRRLTRWATHVDEWCLRAPGLGDAGVVAIGCARKPAV